jgi:hypothetical protein
MFNFDDYHKYPRHYLKALGVWVYLSSAYRKNSCINKEQIRKDLGISIEISGKIFSILKLMSVIKIEFIRDKGKVIGSKTIFISKLNN